MIPYFSQFIRNRTTLACALLCFASGASGASAKYNDDDLMAVYLYRFALLSDWHQTGVATRPVEFCVTEESGVSRRLHDIVLTKSDIATYDNIAQDASSSICHVLYVNEANEEQVAQLKRNYPHALLVGTGAAFIQYGGMIAFVKVNNRIKPMISRENVAPSLIRLRSQLLSVAILTNEEEA